MLLACDLMGLWHPPAPTYASLACLVVGVWHHLVGLLSLLALYSQPYWCVFDVCVGEVVSYGCYVVADLRL